MSTEFETEVDVSMMDDNILVGEDFLGKITIKWSVEFEMRSWGIKSIYLTVPEQKIILNYERDTEDGFVPESKEILLQNVKVEDPINEENFGMIAPHTLEFYDGKVTLQF